MRHAYYECILSTHDASWIIMMHHEYSWCMNIHDASCMFMVHKEYSWCIMTIHDASCIDRWVSGSLHTPTYSLLAGNLLKTRIANPKPTDILGLLRLFPDYSGHNPNHNSSHTDRHPSHNPSHTVHMILWSRDDMNMVSHDQCYSHIVVWVPTLRSFT